MNKITSFTGEYAFLSNFHPFEDLDSRMYLTVENLYQAAKTPDVGWKKQILAASPGKAKKLGRIAPIHPDWEQNKLTVMKQLVYRKFSTDFLLGQKLLKTGDAVIEEGNYWHDTFWGVDAATGEGQNHLGRILMEVRDELRKNINGGM